LRACNLKRKFFPANWKFSEKTIKGGVKNGSERGKIGQFSKPLTYGFWDKGEKSINTPNG